MKKIYILSLLIVIAVTVNFCKKIEKKEAKPIEKVYSVVDSATVIGWTAYKTTDKIPVKGEFSNVTIKNFNSSSSVSGALNGLKFSIPVNSLFTNDTIRDNKLKKFFFGTMVNTIEIVGTLSIENEASGKVNLTMNGITQSLPFIYTVNNENVNIEAVMNLENWQAQTAIEALNIACKDLHTGSDGISKTWTDVKIEVTTNLKYE